MKRVRFTSLMILLLSAVFTFSSCLDSDSESNIDQGGYMTVIKDFMGKPDKLKPDYLPYDYTFTIINNAEALELWKEGKGTGDYIDRGFIYIKFIEGEVFPQEGKKDYKVNVVGVDTYLNVKRMSKPESVEESNPFYQLGSQSNFWGANGYINVPFFPTYEIGEEDELDINDFDLFIDKVSADNKTLLLRLNHSIPKVEEGKSANYPNQTIASFEFPEKHQVLSEFPDLEVFGSTNDSIRVKVTALGINDRELESSEFVIKLLGY